MDDVQAVTINEAVKAFIALDESLTSLIVIPPKLRRQL
jgi:hypothetical protein